MANNNNQNIKDLKEALLEKLPSTRVREQELLCHHTTFKIGGPADLFIEPTTMDELSFTLRTIHELKVPVTVIGCGSNILVKDGGIRGAVVSVRHMTQIMDCNDNVLCIGSGYMLKDASEFAWENGLSGLEFAIGIPGTLGGAVFMNAGAYVTGSQLKRLGEYYAKAIHDTYGDDFDVLFGPAYKGIPLGVVTAIAYSELYGKEVRYCSDRKEEKDHGADKGSFLGSKLKDGDRVIMIEDVTTSGKSMEETVPKVRNAADVTIVGLMVSLNRMEVGKGGEKCALDEIKDLYGFETAAIVSMADVVECLYNKECNGKVVIDDALKAAIDAYYEQYGAK